MYKRQDTLRRELLKDALHGSIRIQPVISVVGADRRFNRAAAFHVCGEDVYKRQDYTITLTRDETENYLKIEDALSFDCDRYEGTPEEVAERFADSPICLLYTS